MPAGWERTRRAGLKGPKDGIEKDKRDTTPPEISGKRTVNSEFILAKDRMKNILNANLKAPTGDLRALFFMILLIGQLSIPSLVQSQPPVDLIGKNVLLLHAYSYEAASSVVMDPIFLKGFMDAGLDGNNLHFEFMDLLKQPEPAHRREFVKYLSRKFEKRPIDLIIAVHRTALSFLVEEGKDLFPGVPVINVIADPEFLSNEEFPDRL